MKKVIIILAVLLGLNIWTSTAQTRSYQGIITVDPLNLQQRGDFLHVDLDVILKDVKVKSERGVDIIPRLVTEDRVLDLPKISIKGREEFLAHERRESLMTDKERVAYRAPYIVINDHKQHADTVKYRYTLPYEPWMAEAGLDVQRDDCGCGHSRLMLAYELIDRVTPEVPRVPYAVIPQLAFVQPAAEPEKSRVVEVESALDFEVNKSYIRADYLSNPRELAKIHSMIDELGSDPSVVVTRIEIIGYASPEGSLAANRVLSERRANALLNYLEGYYEFPRNLYRITFGGENWQGLVKALATVDIKYKDEVLRVIESYSIEQGREKRLMELRGGEPYRFLLRNVFPSLRVAICKVTYNIKNFDVDQAREIIKSRPQNLSLNEMFLVANSYPVGSRDFIDVFETAVRMYPDSEIANLNAATSALLRSDLPSAERYLSRIDNSVSSPEYLNTLGVLALLGGEYDTARTYLTAAREAGVPEAVHNLYELDKKLSDQERY